MFYTLYQPVSSIVVSSIDKGQNTEKWETVMMILIARKVEISSAEKEMIHLMSGVVAEAMTGGEITGRTGE